MIDSHINKKHLTIFTVNRFKATCLKNCNFVYLLHLIGNLLRNSQLDDLPLEMPIIDASVDQELKEIKETKVAIEAMESPSVSTSLPVSRRNTYEIAKEESNMHRQKIEALNELAGVISEESPKSKKEEVKNDMRSWQFEFFFAAVLVSNAIFLGVQTEWAAMYLNKDLPAPFTIVHSIYAILFVAELMWRVSLSGCRTFLCSSDWAWHWLDIAVTFSAVFDVIATLAGFAALTGGSNSGFRLLRVMKIARLVRVIRIIKVGSKKLRMYPNEMEKICRVSDSKTKIRGAKDESEARGYW